MHDADMDPQSFENRARFSCPEDFAKVENFVKPGGSCEFKFTPERHTDQGTLVVLQLGSTFNPDVNLLAWVGHSGVIIGHLEIRRGITVALSHSHISATDSFDLPFRWLEPYDYRGGLDRLKVFVEYLFLTRDIRPIVRKSRPRSAQVFELACRMIVQGMDREERKKRIESASERPATDDTTAPDASYLPQVPENSQVVTLPSTTLNDSLQPIDKVFATFRAGLVEQLSVAQENEHRQSAVLEAQVKALEATIEGVEVEREQLNNELLMAKGEAEKWQAQYEGLRKAMMDIIERRS